MQNSLKNFLLILLATSSLGLCIVVAVQWSGGTKNRTALREARNALQSRSEAALKDAANLKKAELELQRLEGLNQELKRAVKTNSEALIMALRNLHLATNDLSHWQDQSGVNREALAKANDTIRKQNEAVRRQNEDIKKLTGYRDEVIARYNKLAADHNELVRKWNKQQEELMKAASTPAYAPWR